MQSLQAMTSHFSNDYIAACRGCSEPIFDGRKYFIYKSHCVCEKCARSMPEFYAEKLKDEKQRTNYAFAMLKLKDLEGNFIDKIDELLPNGAILQSVKESGFRCKSHNKYQVIEIGYLYRGELFKTTVPAKV